MKQETKELIDWINGKLYDYEEDLKSDCCETNFLNEFDEKRRKAFNFLASFPEIENKLCFGGYIQDKNGTPCCHGDKVRFKFVEKWYEENFKDRYTLVMDGLLQYSKETKSFYIQFGPYHEGWDWLDWTLSDAGCEWFEKVEEGK